jgi:hypothetical protein
MTLAFNFKFAEALALLHREMADGGHDPRIEPRMLLHISEIHTLRALISEQPDDIQKATAALKQCEETAEKQAAEFGRRSSVSTRLKSMFRKGASAHKHGEGPLARAKRGLVHSAGAAMHRLHVTSSMHSRAASSGVTAKNLDEGGQLSTTLVGPPSDAIDVKGREKEAGGREGEEEEEEEFVGERLLSVSAPIQGEGGILENCCVCFCCEKFVVWVFVGDLPIKTD